MSDEESLWVCIATCRVCGKELNRALHVPEHQKLKVELSAPFAAICDEKHHNTFSDCNIGVDLKWEKEEGKDEI